MLKIMFEVWYVHWGGFPSLLWIFSYLQRAQKWKDDSKQTAYLSSLCGATGLPVARKSRWQKVVNKYLGHIPEHCRQGAGRGQSAPELCKL